MPEQKIKPCLICEDEPNSAPYGERWKIFCDQGDHEHIVMVYGKNKEDAIKNWNSIRPDNSEVIRLRDVLGDLLKYCTVAFDGEDYRQRRSFKTPAFMDSIRNAEQALEQKGQDKTR